MGQHEDEADLCFRVQGLDLKLASEHHFHQQETQFRDKQTFKLVNSTVPIFIELLMKLHHLCGVIVPTFAPLFHLCKLAQLGRTI